MNTLQLQPPVPGAERYVYSNAQVVRVIDGDTVILRLPLPFNLSIGIDVRLLGINAPERIGVTAAAGAEAKDYLTANLSAFAALTVQTRKTDKYGRWLAELWTLKGGVWTNVNADMIATGHAVSYWP